MKSAFPPDHELIAFFESEPETLDPGVPWYYNTLSFVSTRGHIEVRCMLQMAEGRLRVALTLARATLLDLDVDGMVSARLECHAGNEAMTMVLNADGRRNHLVLQMRPHVCVTWQPGLAI